MADLKKMLKSFLVFSEPQKVEEFIVRESDFDKKKQKSEEQKNAGSDSQTSTSFTGKNAKDASPKRKPESGPCCDTGNKKKEDGESEISDDINENLEYMKIIYSVPTNSDLMIREFSITIHDKPVSAFIMFFDGMIDRMVINTHILEPLMLLSNLNIKEQGKAPAELVKNRLLPHNQLKVVKKYQDVIDEINFGGCGIFVDGIKEAYAADVKGWEHRSVERPNTELVIRGPQEGFNEILRSNTALIRKIMKDEDLIAENVSVGKRSKTPCAILYIKDITNMSIVSEVRRRIESISVDYILDSGELEQFIEDNSFILAPQIIATERPDRVASMLADGKVAVIVHGSPFALIMPTTNNDLIHSTEDIFLRFPYANLLRFVRIFAVFMSLLLPGFYVAITNYHQEMIPTDLVFAIAAAREKVPFPSVVEILIMEIAFELIREAGIRIPGPIGPTLGIIGALILGQAAVAASIVSPILIIVVAVTGIGSFAIPNFSLAFSFRIMRFLYILLGAVAGFLGITAGVFIQGIWLVSAKSFGVPFMAPFGPVTAGGFMNEFTRAPIWKQERRDDYTSPKDVYRQPKISRGWKKNKKSEEDKGGK